MNVTAFFGLDGYHALLAVVGRAVILAHWLPRCLTRRESAASGLLILLGMAAFALIPGLLAIPDPRLHPHPWKLVSELTIIIALFATGVRTDDLSSLTQWGPTGLVLIVAMPLTIFAVAGLGHVLGGSTSPERSCSVPSLRRPIPFSPATCRSVRPSRGRTSLKVRADHRGRAE